MSVEEFLASQLRQPSGWFGSLVMSRVLNVGNRKIVADTVALLEVRPEHDVLEIGFGGGSALVRLARQASSGVVTGVDVSPEMVKQAERRFRREIEVAGCACNWGTPCVCLLPRPPLIAYSPSTPSISGLIPCRGSAKPTEY